MFSWGGCIIKLLISVAAAYGMGKYQASLATSIFTGVLIYSIISAWWYCCCLSGNYIIGTVLFIVVLAVATWGCSGTNIVLKVLSYIVIIGIAVGGVIADLWGMIRSIRHGA